MRDAWRRRRQIVVASAFPPAADTVVVDERHGRLADPATGRRPKLFALTGAGGDTMEVIGTPGRDRYVADDDLGASIDLDADGDPDFVSTDVGRVVLRGMAGDDVLSDGRSGPRPPGLRARLRHRPRPIRRHRHRMRALAAQEAPMTYLVVGLDQSTFAPWHQNVGAADVATAKQVAFARAQARGHPARDRRRDRAELDRAGGPRRGARGAAPRGLSRAPPDSA